MEYRGLESWGEFLKLWHENKIEEIAVQLLYAGLQVPEQTIKNYDDEEGHIRDRIRFYLLRADDENENIAKTAQQLIVKHWLKKALNFRYKIAAVHSLLLGFLANRKPALLKPPYPRFIAEYLQRLHDQWRGGTTAYQESSQFKQLQLLIAPLVRAILEWGVETLAIDGLRPEITPLIEQYFADKNVDSASVFMALSRKEDPIPDLSFEMAENLALRRAALALFKLQYWIGDGVHAKYERGIPFGKRPASVGY